MAFLEISLTLIGLCAWSLIFLNFAQKSPKCTYDILKIITSFWLIFLTIIYGIFSVLIVEKVNYGVEITKCIVLFVYFVVCQATNTISFFNIYSIVFEHRNPKIDPNLPNWVNWILGIFIPFSITLLTFLLDKLVPLTSKLDFVAYVTNVEHQNPIPIGPLFVIFRFTVFISSAVFIYSTLSRQQDLESSYGLCKFFGLIFLPLIFLCFLFGAIGALKGDFETFITLLQILLGSANTILPIGIISTTEDLRSYSASKIQIIFQAVKVVVIVPIKIIRCKCNENQIHDVDE